MPVRSKLVLAGLTAALLMGLALGSASANRLSLSNRLIRITWANLRFFHEGGGINPSYECPVTLEGSFHSATIAKVRDVLMGFITRGVVKSESCSTNGRATILQERLPWHVTYESFSGTLPNIRTASIRIHGMAIGEEMLLEPRTRTTCLYADRVRVEESARAEFIREEGGNITGLAWDTNIRIPRFTDGGSCPPRMGFEREGQVFLLGSSSTRIRLTLI
jgi:hypothetical protein